MAEFERSSLTRETERLIERLADVKSDDNISVDQKSRRIDSIKSQIISNIEQTPDEQTQLYLLEHARARADEDLDSDVEGAPTTPLSENSGPPPTQPDYGVSPDPSPSPDSTTEEGGGAESSPEPEPGTAEQGISDQAQDVAEAGVDVDDLDDDEIREKILQQYGMRAWVLEHEELGPLIMKAAKENKSPEWVASQIHGTSWFQNTRAPARQWQQLKNEDPAEAHAQINAVFRELNNERKRLGINVSNDRLSELAENALQYGWVDGRAVQAGTADVLAPMEVRNALSAEANYDPPATDARVVEDERGHFWLEVTQGDSTTYHQATGRGQKSGIISMYGDPQSITSDQITSQGSDVVQLFGGPGGIEEVIAGERPNPIELQEEERGDLTSGDLGALRNELSAMASEYMVPVADQTAHSWAQKIFKGTASQEGYTAMLQDMSKGRFPFIREYISDGITPREFFSPYQEQIARELELHPEAVDFEEPQFKEIIEGKQGDDGRLRPYTMSETQNYIRSLPEWETTRAANERAAETIQTIGQMFGEMG